MFVVISRAKLIEAIREAIGGELPKLTINKRAVKTDDSGSYSEPLASQLTCISPDPNVICVQYTDGVNYYVKTYYVSTGVDQNMLVGDTIVHTHSLKPAPNMNVVILEVSV